MAEKSPTTGVTNRQKLDHVRGMYQFAMLTHEGSYFLKEQVR